MKFDEETLAALKTHVEIQLKASLWMVSEQNRKERPDKVLRQIARGKASAYGELVDFIEHLEGEVKGVK